MPAHPLHWRAQLWVNPPRGEAEEDVEELAGEAPRGTHGLLRLGSRARPETAKSGTRLKNLNSIASNFNALMQLSFELGPF